MNEGKYAEACPSFEKALALNPGAGTKFNLAECYEKTGRPATALSLFREVESVTRQVAQHERSAVAKQRADDLERRVPTVVVRAPWLASVPRAAVTLDGRPLTLNDVEKPIRVDFGKHVAVATVDADHETRAEVVIEREGESKTLALAAPVAPPEPRAAAPAPPSVATDARADHPAEPPATSAGGTQRTIGIALGGGGLVAIAVGTVVALSAKSSYEDATATCGTSCPAPLATRANDARAQADLGGIVMGGGAALVAAGAVLFLTAPKGTTRSVGVAPTADRTSFGLAATGAF